MSASRIERQLDDAAPCRPPAHVDVDLPADHRHLRRYVRHADGLLQERRLRTAGHDADGPPIPDDGIAVPRDRALGQFESNELPLHALGLLLRQTVAAIELAL